MLFKFIASSMYNNVRNIIRLYILWWGYSIVSKIQGAIWSLTDLLYCSNDDGLHGLHVSQLILSYIQASSLWQDIH